MRPDTDDGEKRTNEIGTIIPLLETLPDIAGRTVTADALLTQRALASYLLDRGADYLFTVKGNQKTLHDDIRLLLDEDIARREPDFTDQSPKPEHGRRERRSIWVSGELNDYLDFPSIGQVFAVPRETVEVKSGKHRRETAYGVTSLTPGAASQERLLALNRGHWTIEAMHHILDWSFDEDRGRIRTGHGPENMTRAQALRHRPHQGSWPRRRRDHAQSRQKPEARPGLPQNDREHRPAAGARLTAPSQPRPLPRRQPSAHGGERSCPHDAAFASRVQGDRYSAAQWPPNPLPSRRTHPDESGGTIIACRAPVTKIKTNLPWDQSSTSFGLFFDPPRQHSAAHQTDELAVLLELGAPAALRAHRVGADANDARPPILLRRHLNAVDTPRLFDHRAYASPISPSRALGQPTPETPDSHPQHCPDFPSVSHSLNCPQTLHFQAIFTRESPGIAKTVVDLAKARVFDHLEGIITHYM